MKPNSTPEALFAKAQAAEKSGAWSKAAGFYREALSGRGDFLEAQHNLSIALRHLGHHEDALVSARKAAELAPEHPTVQFSLGVSLEQMTEQTAAIAAYKKAIELRPNYGAALNNLGRLLEKLGQIPASIAILERAYAQAPGKQDIRLNLANSYLMGGLPQNADELLNSLIQEDQTNALAHNSQGIAAHVRGDHQRAITSFRKAIQHAQDFAQAHENLAQALLFAEQYEEAWVEYEWRWHNDSNTQSAPAFQGPLWTGDSLAGQTLLVHAEQGFGDIIQFARLLPLIKPDGGKVILACHEALVELLSGLNGQGVDFVIDSAAPAPGFDVQLPLLSLPRILGINARNIPPAPYLAPKPTSRAQPALPLKVGIAWAGMPRHADDPYRNRSCPVEAFKPLLNIAEIKLFSLQTGPNAAELAEISNLADITDLTPQIQSFADTARLVSQLDLIISVDTALAHLAGALGKDLWVLLAISADWRWQEAGRPNPWYPSARIFRQKTPGNWRDLLDDVAIELTNQIP